MIYQQTAQTLSPVQTRINHSVWLQGILLYTFCFAVLAALIFATPGFLGTDDYYHARIATEFIHQGRLALDFQWLPKTILSPDKFVDHHLLFHLYIAVWTLLGGVTGAKLATVSIAAGVFLAAWLLLRQINVRYAALWTLGLFALSTPFLHRMLMIRTQGASLLFLIVSLILLFGRRHRWLVILAFGYVWLYNGFVLLLGISVLYTLGTLVTEKRLEWKPIAFTALGLILGLVINPFFPNNLLFITEHLGAKVDFENGVRVGNEWYPYSTAVLMANSGGALLVLAIGVLRGQKRDRVETVLLFAALLTLFMVLRSRRFIEYYPAFALLFCAAAWGRGDIALPAWVSPALKRSLLPVGIAGTVLLLGSFTLLDTLRDVQDAPAPDYLVGAADWLEANTPQGTMIFQTDWDDFTRLFYANTHNTYLVGLDPTYLQRADPALWDEWVAITQGRVSRPSEKIVALFGTTYVVSDTRHDDFENQVLEDPNMQLVYMDKYSYVWQIVPPV